MYVSTQMVNQINAELSEAKQAIQRVRELHKPSEMLGIWDAVCSVCTEGDLHDYVEYPCPTIKALDGEPNV